MAALALLALLPLSPLPGSAGPTRPASAARLIAGTYLGGSADDHVQGMVVDGQGNIYVTGHTSSLDFPGAASKSGDETDLFVAKVSPSGAALLWSVVLGGSAQDEGRALALDDRGGLWVTGVTASPDFPISRGYRFQGVDDAVVLNLDAATGAVRDSWVYGSMNLDEGNAIAVDRDGHAYITGMISDKFNQREAFLLIVDGQTHSFRASNSFGSPSGEDVGNALALDGDGNVYITGQTAPAGQADDFPVVEPLQAHCGARDSAGNCGQDAFVVKLGPGGQGMLYSTYLGGSYAGGATGAGADSGAGIAVGPDGSIYVTGQTFASDFPTVNAAQPAKRGPDNQPDAFVLRLDPATNTLIFSTYLGGDTAEESRGLAVDTRGNLYVAGLTNSPDFPTRDALQSALGAGMCPGSAQRRCYDAFAAHLSAAGALVWSTYLGGGDDDHAAALALDGARGLLIAGATESGDFPMPAGGAQSHKALKRDGFVVRIGAAGNPPWLRRVYLPLIVGG
jgi:hypothetical protein